MTTFLAALNEEHRGIFKRYYFNAVKGGCDHAQAESIAREKTLYDVMKASAAIAAVREQMTGRLVAPEILKTLKLGAMPVR